MGKTTISVETRTRDRLSAWAAKHGRPMGEEIEVLLDIAEHHEFWEKVSIGYAHGYAGGDDDEYPEYAHLGPVGPIPSDPDMIDDIPTTVLDK